MNMGLDYERARGLFSVKSCNDIEKLMDTLSDILGTEVAFLQSCTNCGKDFQCTKCKYQDLCTTKALPLTCICPQCLKNKKLS